MSNKDKVDQLIMAITDVANQIKEAEEDGHTEITAESALTVFAGILEHLATIDFEEG